MTTPEQSGYTPIEMPSDPKAREEERQRRVVLLSRVGLFISHKPNSEMDGVRDKVVDLLEAWRYEPGTVIYRQGDTRAGLHIVDKGGVKSDYLGSIHAEVLGPDSYFGETALLDNHRSSSTMVAAGEGADLLILPHDRFTRLRDSDETVMKTLIESITRRVISRGIATDPGNNNQIF